MTFEQRNLGVDSTALADEQTAEPEFELTRLMGSARELLGREGVRDISPHMVVIAATKPKDLRDITFEATVGANLRTVYARKIAGESPSEEQDQVYGDGRIVDDQAYMLGRRSRRRTLIGAGALAFMLGTGFLFEVGRVKADLTEKIDNDNYKFKGDQIVEGNHLTWDDHLLSGDTGTDIPVLGSVVRLVPGIPDYGQTVATYTHEREIPVGTFERVTLEGSYGADEVVNPVAPELQLTGAEYDQARAMAAQVLESVDPNKFTAKELHITGYVSDEFNNELGVVNPEQQPLADARAAEVMRAFADEAMVRGISLDGIELNVVGKEAVLTPDQISQANTYATELGMSDWRELLSAYDAKSELPSDVGKFLVETFRRGADLTLVGEVEETELVQETELVEEEQNSTFNDIPGELVFVFGTLLPIGYGAIYSTRRFGRAVRRRARRAVKKAGLDLRDVDSISAA